MTRLVVDLAESTAQLGLDERVARTPPDARVRGVWFALTRNHLERAGEHAVSAWRSAAAPQRRLGFRMYPAVDYVRELALAGAVLSPADPGQAIREIWRDATASYREHAFGRALSRLLQPNPIRYMAWLVAHRDHFCSYGAWALEVRGAGHVVMHFRDELVWIDTAHRGGAEGLLATCGAVGSVEPILDDPYNGRLHIRWDASQRRGADGYPTSP